jgi:pyruvate, orthophosphate dikinase
VVSGRSVLKDAGGLEFTMPHLYEELVRVAAQLERMFGDMQDFEFTVQEGRLYLLQARHGKRTPLAALRIACDLVDEGLLGPKEALNRLSDYDLENITDIRLAAAEEAPPLRRGTPAGPGVATGPITFDPDGAVTEAHRGTRPILMRSDITTADLRGLEAAAGVLTARGGRTAHGAVVARQLGGKECKRRNDPPEADADTLADFPARDAFLTRRLSQRLHDLGRAESQCPA